MPSIATGEPCLMPSIWSASKRAMAILSCFVPDVEYCRLALCYLVRWACSLSGRTLYLHAACILQSPRLEESSYDFLMVHPMLSVTHSHCAVWFLSA